jgi:hypothetical protein
MAESKKQYTLHFVWLDGCGGCVAFKKNHQTNFEETLKNHPLISYSNQEYKRDDANRHLAELAQYINWFPTFILTKNKQVVDVFNANVQVKNGVVSCEHAQKMQLTGENVIRWAESVINNPGYIQDNSPSIGSQRFVSKTCRSTNNYRPSN